MTKEQLRKEIKKEIEIICIKDEKYPNKDFIVLKDEKVERRSEKIASDISKYVKLSNFNEILLLKKKVEKRNNYYVITFEISLHDTITYFNLNFNEIITIFESDIQIRF